MGLLSILKKLRRREKEVRVLMVGLDNSGKTSIANRLQGIGIEQVSPTLGFNITTLVKGDVKLNLWDIGGQTSLRSYWRNYYESTDIVIWVVDSWDVARLAESRAELENLLIDERLLSSSLLVLANKLDLMEEA